ncbi:hypothetical protein LTR94_028944, partial [Friedmanniomyces endolithicus]
RGARRLHLRTQFRRFRPERRRRLREQRPFRRQGPPQLSAVARRVRPGRTVAVRLHRRAHLGQDPVRPLRRPRSLSGQRPLLRRSPPPDQPEPAAGPALRRHRLPRRRRLQGVRGRRHPAACGAPDRRPLGAGRPGSGRAAAAEGIGGVALPRRLRRLARASPRTAADDDGRGRRRRHPPRHGTVRMASRPDLAPGRALGALRRRPGRCLFGRRPAPGAGRRSGRRRRQPHAPERRRRRQLPADPAHGRGGQHPGAGGAAV